MTTDDRSNSLTVLAARINAEHDAMVAAARSAVAHGMNVGDMLLKAKGQVEHGQWMRWLQANCRVSARSARRCMQLAEQRAKIESEMATVANLTLNHATALLGEDSPGKVAERESRHCDRWRFPPEYWTDEKLKEMFEEWAEWADSPEAQHKMTKLLRAPAHLEEAL